MILPPRVQGPPSLPLPRADPQRSPAGTAPRDTLVVSSWEGMSPCFCLRQVQILPDTGLLHHGRRVYAVQFHSAGPTCQVQELQTTVCSNLSCSPKGGPAAPVTIVPSLFLSWRVGTGMLRPCPGSKHCLWHVLWSAQR